MRGITGRTGRNREGLAGFTLIELLVTLGVLALVMAGLLTLFDFSGRVARVQTHVADMQQSVRIGQHQVVRMVRMAGRGGLPQALAGDDLAVEVRNDAGESAHILVGDDTSPDVVEGSDVLILRGVFNSPVYQINSGDAASLTVNNLEGTGTLRLRDPSPTGVPQDLQPFRDLLADGGRRDAILLVSPVGGAIAVVELNPTGSSVNTTTEGALEVTRAVLNFFIRSGGENADAYHALYGSPATFPMQTAAHAGILEEYRFYLRDVVAGAAPGSPTSPKLSMARVFPGTEVAYRSADNLRLDIADNVVDFQVALAYDANGDGNITENAPAATTDEWFYNVAGDGPPGTVAPNPPVGNLSYVRLSTLARTDRPDPGYESNPLAAIEDRDYTSDPLNTDITERRYRRRLLRTTVDLRNLG